MIHKETITPKTMDLIHTLSADPELKNFVLAGDTSLALQLGHRKSNGIDLVAKEPFDKKELLYHLHTNYELSGVEVGETNLHGHVGTVAVRVGESAMPDVKSPVQEGGIRMASMEDLAAMKAGNIYRHGALNADMVDVYYLLEHMTMGDIVNAYEAKHPGEKGEVIRRARGSDMDVRAEKKVEVLRRGFDWRRVLDRISDAARNPDKLYEGPKIKRYMRRSPYGGPGWQMKW